VLDLGAGLGDFLVHLWMNGIDCDYTGLDLCEHLMRAAGARFAEAAPPRPRFVVGDILEQPEPREPTYDYVVSSGVFGLKTAATVERVVPTLERMFALCRRAVAVNLLSARTERRAARSEYFEPSDILQAALRITPAITLRHDYLPNDFTLFLYREQRWPVLAD
jgi:ubiquinone/menaquinone biosynthesis C-methylase UbiE